MAPWSPSGLVTEWAPGPLLLLPAVLALGYLALVTATRRVGGALPWWRVAVFLAGTLVLAWATNGAPAVRRADAMWWGTLSVGLTTAVVPLALALGDPVAVWERWRGHQVRWLRGRLARVVMFPALASLVAAAVVTLVFTGGWYDAALTSGGDWALLQVTVLVVGLLVNVPLLSEDLLPAWCTPGLRTLFAFADGVLDAVPGIVVMASIDWVAGGTLLAVSESVGVPMIFAVLAQWVRADEVEAREVDARLDAAEADAHVNTVDAEPADERPWWESDPRLAHRFRRPPISG